MGVPKRRHWRIGHDTGITRTIRAIRSINQVVTNGTADQCPQQCLITTGARWHGHGDGLIEPLLLKKSARISGAMDMPANDLSRPFIKKWRLPVKR
jgi:hypothetical protein